MAISLELEHSLGDPVAGVDEAGRGPLAGGVYAACVSVPLALADELLVGAWAGVNDSKKLSPKRRDELAEVIKATPGCVWAVASASPAEIDRLNILHATHLAMRRAVDEVAGIVSHGGTETPLSILVDGLPVVALPNSTNVVKGDAKSLFIAAASILAKTARDADCLRLEREYPGYGFAKHKGYPTKEHMAALRRLGPCPEHRRSFGPVCQQEFDFSPVESETHSLRVCKKVSL
jgi:ribonuclease HII